MGIGWSAEELTDGERANLSEIFCVILNILLASGIHPVEHKSAEECPVTESWLQDESIDGAHTVCAVQKDVYSI